MNRRQNSRTALRVAAFALALGGGSPLAEPDDDQVLIDHGRYLVTVAGCNDCHTPGYMAKEGKVPEEHWLTGDGFGWRGPWGTTYSANLRILMHALTEEQWLDYAKNLRTRPPMPWFNLNQMEPRDLRAIYRFARHLGPGGERPPPFVPPDREPNPPYASFPAPPEP